MSCINRLKKLCHTAKGARLLAAAILFAAPGLAAGATGFSGRVTQEDGVTGIAGVTVQVLNPADDSVVYSNTTGGDGSFDVPTAVGTYHIQAVPSGYFPGIRSSHTLTADQYKTINFALQSTGSEAWRDNMSAQNWAASYNFVNSYRLSSNGNVVNMGITHNTTGGNQYLGITQTMTANKTTYPYITVRNKMNLTSGAVNTPVLVFDYPGPWNYAVGVLNSGAQSWPWQDRTHVITYDMAGILFILGDPSAAPAVADQYLDYVIIHSVDRGFAAGQVTGKYGTPLANTRVQLRKGSAVVGEGLTDASGNYQSWAAVGSGYNVYVSSGGAEYVSGSLALTGRTQTTVNVAIDTAPPSAVTGMFAVGEENVIKLYWTAPGDDWGQGTLNNSSFTIQHATYTSVNWSTAAAQVTISTSGVAAGSASQYNFSGLAANTTHYFRLWTKDAYGTYSGLSNGATAVTMIEQPTSVYIDEVGSGTILASAYAPAFTNLDLGSSGVSIDTSTDFNVWGSTGNYWAARMAMGQPRDVLSAGVVGGRLYAVGGRNGGGYVSFNEEYDPVSNYWMTKAAMPTARGDLAVGAIGGRLYAVGGWSGSYLNKNEEYDPAANAWTTKASMPTARRNLAAGAIGGRLYAVGGHNGANLNTNEEYDPAADAWHTKATLPTLRNYMAAGVVAGKLYVVGGYTGPTLLNTNHEYDPAANSWATKAVMPTARAYLSAAAIGGKLYAVGGYDGSDLRVNEEYDPAADAWLTKAAMPTARDSFGMGAIGGRLYAAGGWNGGAYESANEVYSPGVSRQFSGLRPNSWYQFSAKSRNQKGLVGAQSIPWVSTFTLASVGPPWFGAPAFTNIQTSNLTVNWSSGTPSSYNNPGATYKVQVSTLPDFSVLAGNVNTGDLSYQFSGLPANATHYARIQAYNSSGITDYTWVPLGSTVTAVETPSSVYFDEVSTYSLTASAYAASLSNLAWGLSGVNLTTGAAYGNWTSGGDSWTARNNILVPKHGAAAAALGGKIYVMGGTSEGLNYSADTYVYDPAANSWSTRSAMPTARYLLAAAAAGGKIYALGGYNNLAGGVLGANQEYDPAANAWRSAAPMPTPRERLAAVSAGGKIYALGGYNSVDYSNNEIYDPANNSWITGVGMPTARKSLAAAHINGKIYAVGGDSSGYKNVNEEYDLTSKTWSTKAAMPTARNGLAAAVIGGKLYAVSGFNGAHLNKNEAYDPGYNAWSDKKPIPVPREGMAYAATGGKLYAIGGNDGTYLSSTTAYFPGVSKTFTGLQPNTQYSLMVKARNQAGAETGSMGMFNAYTLAVATVPAGPAVQVTSPHDAQVTWSSGSQAGGYNGPNASYRVEASTTPDFNGQLRFQTPWDFTQSYFGGLEPRTTYYFRVQAYNNNGITDYSWVVLGSTQTPAEPLGGAVVSTMGASGLAMNPARRMARDSQGNLYLAYYRLHQGKTRVFVSRSSDGGDTWADTTGVPVETAGDYPSANSYNQGADMSLAIDSKDVLHLVWGGVNNLLDASGGAESKCVYSSAAVPGTSWSPHVKIPANAYNGSEGQFTIAVDSNDGLHIVWIGQDCGSSASCYQLRYSSRAAASSGWAPYTSINSDGKIHFDPALAIDARDGLHIVARHGLVADTWLAPLIVYSSRTVTTGWGAWTEVYNGGSFNQGEPALTMTPDEKLFTAWYTADATYPVNSQIKYSVKPVGGAWTPAAYVSVVPEAPQMHPSAAADALGSVYVLWSGSDSVNSVVNLKGSAYNGSAWDEIEGLTDESSGFQKFPALRWSGWRNNGGSIDVQWNSWDGTSSTTTLRVMQGSDVPMSPGWSKTPWPVPAGCGYALNVKQDGAGDFAGIGQALNAVPQELSTTTCVVLRDAETYGEQVTVQGIQTGRWEGNSHRLILMKDPTFVSSSPVVSPPAFSEAAFKILTASVTVQGFTIMPAYSVTYGILASSESVRISSVSVISGGMISAAGIQISSYSAVENSALQMENAHGVKVTGRGSSISYSTITSRGYGYADIYLSGASSNVISRNYLQYTMSYNEGYGVHVGSFSNLNEVSSNTIALDDYATGINMLQASSNTFYGNFVYGPSSVGLSFYDGASYNTVANSTFSTSQGGLWLQGAVGNNIENNYVYTGGDALTFNPGSSSNTAAGNMFISTSSTYGVITVVLSGASASTLSDNIIYSQSGPGLDIYNSVMTGISRSTITAGGDWNGLTLSYASAAAVTDCYIQGAYNAMDIFGSTQVSIGGSVFVTTVAANHGLWAAQSVGILVSSSTFRGGPQGAGIYLAEYNSGGLVFSSSTLGGGKYGFNIATQAAGSYLRLSSVTLQDLSPGATAINFLGGQFNPDTEYIYFSSPNIAINVNARDLNSGSYLFMSHPDGRWGALYENDPGGYVHWPTASAIRVSPEGGAVSVSPAAVLRARSEGGSAAAQYHFQVDYAPGMNSNAGNPVYSFDQSMMQAYYNTGAFSGQDSTMTVAGDAYLFDSIANFVFYSTNTPLAQNTGYFWRVRVKSESSGEYGQWSSTFSFTTGEPASNSPVNDIAVRSVGLSSPSVAGVNVGFTLYANNVSTGMTPNGAAYNTAEWIFVKFSTQAGADGTWNHATLSGGTVGSPDTLTLASDGKGVFIDHTVNAGNWNYASTVTWNYAADGVTGGNALVKVFAISMVKVPQGQFVYNAGGIGGSDYNNYGNGSQSNVLSATDRPTGAATGWPNGYGSFYIMRYELTQGQYADFLNTVHSSTAAALYISEFSAGHSMSNGGVYPNKYSTADRFAAKNYLSPSDLWSFLSWAALRPMTEMEFEKAARDVSGDTRKYPWDNTEPDSSTYLPVNEGGTHVRNFMNFYPGTAAKVLDVGRYMSGDVYRTPEQTGASPYGIADLAGNVNELILNCSYTNVPDNGNGTVAWPAVWPAPDSAQIGTRGGGFTGGSSNGRISQRTTANLSWNARLGGNGGRGGRTP